MSVLLLVCHERPYQTLQISQWDSLPPTLLCLGASICQLESVGFTASIALETMLHLAGQSRFFFMVNMLASDHILLVVCVRLIDLWLLVTNVRLLWRFDTHLQSSSRLAPMAVLSEVWKRVARLALCGVNLCSWVCPLYWQWCQASPGSGDCQCVL